jgi:hypothetical protein
LWGELAAGGLNNRVIALGLDQLILYVSAAAFEDGLRVNGRTRRAR